MKRFNIMLLFVLLSMTSPVFAQYQSYAYQNNSGAFGGRNGSSFNGGFSNFNSQNQQAPQQQRLMNVGRQQNPSSTMSDLERKLDAVDDSRVWANVPVSGATANNQRPAPTQYSNPRYGPSSYVPARANTYARQGGTVRSYPVRRVTSPGGGAGPSANSGMFPGISRQEMLRVFIEGGMPESSGSQAYQGFNPGPPQNSSSNSTNAYYNYQTAENEATKARNYANTARYDKNKWNRKNAASQAEYAANNANYAAQRAESAAYSGDSKTRGYANLARQAANRARNNANQARYNANTIQ